MVVWYYGTRRLKKYNVSVVIGSQGLGEIMASASLGCTPHEVCRYPEVSISRRLTLGVYFHCTAPHSPQYREGGTIEGVSRYGGFMIYDYRLQRYQKKILNST